MNDWPMLGSGVDKRRSNSQDKAMRQHPQEHWSKVYNEKAPDPVSWYQATPGPSMEALDRFGATAASPLIDIGGGASNLVDALLSRGWQDVTVLDIAEAALEAARQRLGQRAAQVHWQVADTTNWRPHRLYDVWHDRAVFHFLTEPKQRQAYKKALEAGIAQGGLVIMATFAPDGPEKCSGLPVQRYDPASLATELGDDFHLIEGWREEHLTPSGNLQSFNWCAFRRFG